jgi:hypothetical protein
MTSLNGIDKNPATGLDKNSIKEQVRDVTATKDQLVAKDLTPEELQLEIARTRSVITEDLRALGERFAPEHLKESARELLHDAREEATALIHEAKEAAFGSLRGVKDRALESVQERVSMVGTQARRAGDMTVDFVTQNRRLLSMLGLGAGALLMILRGGKLLPASVLRLLPGMRGGAVYEYEHYNYPLDEPPIAPRGDAISADMSSPYATRRSEGEQLYDARPHRRLGEVARDNRGLVVAGTILAGIGLGLLLPVSRRPRRAIARAGERVWDGAQAAARQGLSQAEHQYARAREAIRG